MLPRFRHLLVPLDFTVTNDLALDIAFEIARENQARVTLLHVIETIDDADGELKEFFDRLETRAQTELEARAQRFSEAGLQIDRKYRFGRRAAEIVLDALERKVDLIVMSSHPIDPNDPHGSLATVSYQVSVLCHCAVLLIK